MEEIKSKFRALGRAVIYTDEGRYRWPLFIAASFILVLAIAGMLIGALYNPAPKSDPAPEATAASPSKSTKDAAGESKGAGVTPGDKVLLNPETKLTREGRIPIVETADPGDFAEAYTRAAQTMSVAQDDPGGWTDALAQWHTSFVPGGFEKYAWNDRRKTDARVEAEKVWTNTVQFEPEVKTFTTGVFIDEEIADKLKPTEISYYKIYPWVNDLRKDDQFVHVIHTQWTGTSTPTKSVEENKPRTTDGEMEMVVVCPGYPGYTEKSCKIVRSETDQGNFLTATLLEYPGE